MSFLSVKNQVHYDPSPLEALTWLCIALDVAAFAEKFGFCGLNDPER